MQTSLTRTIRFEAAHRYWKPEWSEAQNRKRFGPAANEHSHEYTCAITVQGSADPDTGMLVDLSLLDQILDAEVLRRFKGRALHREVAEFREGGNLPTCEAIARDVFTRVAGRLPPGVLLEAVRIAEDETLSAECRRDTSAAPPR